MKRLWHLVVVAAVVAVMAAPAVAQERQRQRQPGGRGPGMGGFGGGTLFLLTQKSVQEDLKLSEDQVKQIKELSEKQRGSFRDLQGLSREERQKKMAENHAATEKAIAKVLKPKQLKRVNQISLQRRGAQALSDPKIASALQLTDKQKDEIKAIHEESRKEMRELFQGGNREEAGKKLAELRKSTNEKVMKVLTAKQKDTLKELQGEPFKGEIQRPQFGGGRGGRGGARPNR